MNQQATLAQVGVGVHVEVELVDQQGGREQMAFDIVREEAADVERGLLGANTPLVKAIRGKAVGAVVPYVMGDICQVRIVRVSAAQTPTPAVATEQRAAILKRAREAIERTNAEMFAASYSGKWGDYQLDDGTGSANE